MDRYSELAAELFSVLDRSHKDPPHAEVSATLRGEMAVLRLLNRQANSLSAGEISRRLEMTTSRIAAVLNALQKKGMILRCADAADKRRVQVTLTEQGRVFCEQKRAEALGDLTRMLRGLGEEDAAHFVRIMRRIQTIMPEPACAHADAACDQEEAADER